MIEEWASIPGADNAFASTMGRIMRNGEVIPQRRCQEGYMRVTVGGEIGQNYVHRLVLLAFRNQPAGKTCVNHRNGKKDDNRLKNLEWSTPRENSMYAALRGEWKKTSKARKIKGTNLETGETEVFNTQSEAARMLNIHNSEINKMLHGKRNTCHGYRFEYLDEEAVIIREPNQIPGQISIFDYEGVTE